MKTPFKIDVESKQVFVYLPKMRTLRGVEDGEWLNLEELRKLVRDIKNSVETFAGCAPHKLVTQSKGLNALFESDEFAHAIASNDTVNNAVSVSDSDAVLAGATAPLAGFFIDKGRYFLVKGERVYAVDDLILHGVIGHEDFTIAAYMMKYLQKSVEVAA
jgi:hypothetical protein